MVCYFCKVDKAIHLDPKLPLCQTCVELRDFMQDYKENRKPNQKPEEYALDVIQFYNPNLNPGSHGSPCVTVH